MLKIKISDISEEGIDIEEDLTSEYIGLSTDEPLYFKDPVHVKAFLRKVKSTVIAEATVEGIYKSQCYRTLEDVEREWSIDFYSDYVINENDEFVELGEDIRQEILLNIPLRVLCDSEQAKEDKLKESGEDKELEYQEADTYQPFADLRVKED